jgi:hypothetical protein
MINLTQLFDDLGINFGPTIPYGQGNQYDFFNGIVWNDGDITYNQYEFFKKIGISRYDFFKQYISEYDFYQNINDPNITDYKTFYEYAPFYYRPNVLDWILGCGFWDDTEFWYDTEFWEDNIIC